MKSWDVPCLGTTMCEHRRGFCGDPGGGGWGGVFGLSKGLQNELARGPQSSQLTGTWRAAELAFGNEWMQDAGRRIPHQHSPPDHLGVALNQACAQMICKCCTPIPLNLDPPSLPAGVSSVNPILSRIIFSVFHCHLSGNRW